MFFRSAFFGCMTQDQRIVYTSILKCYILGSDIINLPDGLSFLGTIFHILPKVARKNILNVLFTKLTMIKAEGDYCENFVLALSEMITKVYVVIERNEQEKLVNIFMSFKNRDQLDSKVIEIIDLTLFRIRKDYGG